MPRITQGADRHVRHKLAEAAFIEANVEKHPGEQEAPLHPEIVTRLPGTFSVPYLLQITKVTGERKAFSHFWDVHPVPVQKKGLTHPAMDDKVLLGTPEPVFYSPSGAITFPAADGIPALSRQRFGTL